MQAESIPAKPTRRAEVCMIPAARAEMQRKAVAAYCRVSTNALSQETSIENQRIHYKRIIEANPQWIPAGIYWEAGVSGTEADTRPVLQRLMADCRAGRVDMIITKSISRFSRNTADCLALVRELDSLGVALVFEKEHLRTDLMDSEFFLTVFAAFSQEESHSLSGNMKWAIRKRFRDGSYKGAKAPYGYRKTEGGRYAVEPQEAEVVRRIFTLLLAGRSSAAIAGELNAEHIPTWSMVNGAGDIPWSGGRIRQIARNRFYVGDTLRQKTFRDDSYRQRQNRGQLDLYLMENAHPAIVDRETFALADAAIRRNGAKYGAEKAGSKRTNRYCFSGRLICGVCGGKMGRGGRDTPFYLCQRHAREGACPMKPIPEKFIRSAFRNMLNKLVFALRCGLPLLILGPESAAELQRLREAMAVNQRRWDAIYDRMVTESHTSVLLKERAALEREALELVTRAGYLTDPGSGNALRCQVLRRGIRAAGDPAETDEEIFRCFVDKALLWRNEKLECHFSCGLCLSESLRLPPKARELPVYTRFRLINDEGKESTPISDVARLYQTICPLT